MKKLLFSIILFATQLHAQCWLNITAGGQSSLGITSDHTLWAWGSNYNGQYGNDTNIDINEPQQTTIGETWASVKAGGYHVLALKADGTL